LASAKPEGLTALSRAITDSHRGLTFTTTMYETHACRPEVVTTEAATTRPTTQSLIKWSSHRSNSRNARLDAITPARVKVCLLVANLLRWPSQLAGPSSLGEGFILPITPHPLDRLPAHLHGTRGPRSGTKGQQCTNKQPQQHRRYRRNKPKNTGKIRLWTS
jgi:hypothetical protein